MNDSLRGFTMIELAIVVAIIGVLAAVAIPLFDSFSDKSKIDELKSNMLVAATAQEKYLISKGAYTADKTNLYEYSFPKDGDNMKYRTGIIVKNGVGISYWINGVRKIRGENHCWLYVSSMMGTTDKANFKELKANEKPYTGVDCSW